MISFSNAGKAVLVLLLAAACKKELQPEAAAPEAEEASAAAAGNRRNLHDDEKGGRVYTLSNGTAGNQVLVYERRSDGSLHFLSSVPAGGNGTGGGLGNQGALILADDDETLLAVNAGSNTISSFKVTGNGLNLRSTVNSGGTTPVSITVHGDLVYVLNAGGSGNISGFRLGNNRRLEPIANSTKPLSSTAAGAAQVSFVRNGRVLVVTEKATNKIISYTVGYDGRPGDMRSITSATPTPFGFAAGRFGNIYVSEAAGGAAGASKISSYNVSHNGSITVRDPSVGAGQSAACWVVLSANGRFTYVTNTASNNISTFSVHPLSGNLDVAQAIAATSDAGPIDAAVSKGSRYLYVLNGAGRSITGYKTKGDGSLEKIETVTGLPAGANGLAAE